ncbi:proteoglycan 4-like isoform X2 [Aedes aegypti]|uniref:Uncharacterized protein n=1 Tax=Aedes aegypti TaxID=7159 RepID=A0A6I8U9F4_AEDAE|nr:proteoglycan 4-like isoform X2 [Aedes aegypti]
MKVPILLVLSIAILTENGCFGQQRTTPHSGQRTTPHSGQRTTPQPTRTTTRPRTTLGVRGAPAQSGKLVNASPVRQTTPARVQSANIIKPQPVNPFARPLMTTRTTPRSNGKVTTTLRSPTATRTTTRITTRTTQKNSKLVDGRGTTPKITTRTTTKMATRTTPRQATTTKKIGFKPVFTSVTLPGISLFGNPSFFGMPLSFPTTNNWTDPVATVPSSNFTDNELTESVVEPVTVAAANTSTTVEFSTSSTTEYEIVETSTTEPTTMEPTRKKLKRRIRINAETGQRQVVKRRKVPMVLPEETEEPQ